MKKPLLLLMMLCSLFVKNTMSQTASTVSLNGTSSTNTVTKATATVVDPGLTISSDGTISDFTVQITGSYTNGDVLDYTGSLPSGITVLNGGFYTTYKALQFAGIADAATWQELLRRVTITTANVNCYPEQRQVSFVVGPKLYNLVNGHFYEKSASATSWTTGYNNAQTTSYFGRQAYMVTITSAAENSLVASYSQSWLGASDDKTYVNTAAGYAKYSQQGSSTGTSSTGSEGFWHWVTGPEKGTLFSSGNTGSGTPITAAGQYANWNGGEPNGNNGGENFGQMLSGGTGQWNDLGGGSSLNTIYEYGDMSTDNVSSKVVFTRTISLSGAPSGTIIGGDNTVCSGTNSTTLILSGLASGGTVSKWQLSTDNFITTTNTTDIANTTISYTATNITKNTFYRALVNTTGCTNNPTSSTIINVNAAVPGNIVADNNTICNGASVNFTINGYSGSIVKWQVSTSSTFANNITGISNTTAAMSYQLNTAGTYYFRAVVLSCSNTVYTNIYTISVVNGSAPVGGTVSSANFCGGSNSGSLSLTGSTGTVSKWQYSTDGGIVWTDVANTTTSLSYSAITATRRYRASLTNGACGTALSGVGIVTVSSASVAGTASGAAAVCAGTNSKNLSLSGSIGSIQWQSSTDNSIFNNIAGATTSSYTASNLSATTYYLAVVKNGVCTAANSNSVTITVKQTTTSTNNLSICPSQIPYVWNGLTFNASGSQTKTGLQNSQGCDSTATLNLTVTPPPASFSYATSNTYMAGTAISPLSPSVASSTTTLGSGFNTPYGVAVDAAGNIFITEFYTWNWNVKKMDATGNNITTLGSGFNNPAGVAVDAAGNIYVAEFYNGAIKKMDATGNNITTLASGFIHPNGVAVDAAGNIYVADYGNNAIKKMDANGNNITTLGSGFNGPTGVTLDAAGNIYVADNGNNAIKKMDANGNNITTLRSGFDYINGISVDAAGNIYVVDYYNHAIKKMDANGNNITTLGSGFYYPTGVAVDAAGNVYVADYYNNAIKIIAAANTAGNYSIAPSLPTGLSFNTQTGAITGTPTRFAAAANYTITASSNNSACTSTAIVNIAVSCTPTSSTTDATICSVALPFYWNGLTFTVAGSQTAHLTNSQGCDSAATLNLTVLSTSTSSTSATICANQAPYLWNSNNYSSTGSYTVHFTNSVGCDSAATLNLTVNTNPSVAPIAGLTNIEILAIGGGGGAGGPDGTLGAGGGAGGAVYGSYTLSTTGSNIYTVAVGGAGGFGQGCSGNAAGGTAGVNGGATGGNAGNGGCSGGGGGSGGWSGLYQGSNYIVVAGGGAGGGGSNEGTANNVTTPGGGNQSAANGTSMSGQNGTAYSGDGGGGGAGGGGYYGGAGQSNLTQIGYIASQAWGGANYANSTGRNSYATYIGNSGATASTGTGGVGTTSTITNAGDFNYTNTYGKGGNVQGNSGTSTTANGNNGVVIIRYLGLPVATGGTITQSGGYTLHTFTTAGSNTFTASSVNAVCVGSTALLNCATAGGVWTSSDTTIAQINPSTGMVTGIAEGIVTITYTITNANGCVGSSTKSLTVNPLPTASIIGSTTLCQNLSSPLITFTGSNATAPYTFTYTINGGTNQTVTTTSGNSVTVSVPTSVAGTYVYSLVSVKDASSTTCSANVTGYATVVVNPKPTAGADVNYLCGGATQTLNGTANTGIWSAMSNNPTGDVLSTTNPGVATVSFANLTIGTFNYIYALSTGCSDTMSIVVRPKPNAGADQSICYLNGTTGVTLISNVVGSWSAKSGNAGTSVIATPNAQSTLVNNFSAAGDYNYINTNNGCTDTVKVTVTPVGSISNYVWKDQNNDGLQNEPASNGVNNITVELYKKDGNGAFNLYASTTTTNNVNGNPGYYNFGLCEDGVYKVKVPTVNPFTQTHLTTQNATAATDGNSDVDPADGFSPEVTIDTHGSGVAKDNNTIDAGYQICTKPIAGSDFNTCGGQLVAITGQSTTPALPTTDGNWSAGSGNPVGATIGTTILGVATIQFDSLSSGVYSFIYTVTGGCDDTLHITVNPKPSAGIDVSSVCGGQSQTVIGLPSNGIWSQLSSNASGATVGSTANGTSTINFTNASTGIYTFIYTVPSGCSDTMTINAFPKPDAGIDVSYICGGHFQTLIATPGTGTWTAMNGNPIGAKVGTTSNGVATVDFSDLSTGVYSFIYTVPSGCTDTMSITAYPKPNAGADITEICGGSILSITGTPATGTWSQLATNPSGATVGTTSNGVATINFANLVSGTYTFIFTSVAGCTDTMTIGTKAKPNAGVDKYLECGSSQKTDNITATPTGGTWTSMAGNSIGMTLGSTNAGKAILTLPLAPLQGTWYFIYTAPNGCNDTMKYVIGVAGNPVPAINGGSNPLCKTSTLQLCPTVWGWSNYQWYRNGVAISGQRGASSCITIDTATLGSYTLSGSNGSACWSAQSTPILVYSASPATPIISFTGSTSICNGGSITLTSSATSGNQWKKDGVTISGATAQTHTATASGVYSVAVTGNCGTTTSAGTTVTVAPAITVAAISSTSNSVCLGNTITLTNTTVGGVWSSSNTAVATVNAFGVVTPISSGTVTINYTVSLNGCSKTVTYILTIPYGVLPTAPIIVAQSSTSLCGSNTVQLCPAAYGWSNYQWYKNGVAVTTNGASACIVIDTSRLGSYTLAATMGTCWFPQSNAIAVAKASAPAIPTILTAGSTSICGGGNVLLTSSSTIGNQWNKDGVAIIGATSQSCSVTTSGVYTVTVSVCGSTTSAGTTVTVDSPITVAIIVGGGINVCSGTSVTLTDATPGGVWSSSNAAIATINASGVLTPLSAGTVTISYTVTVGSCNQAVTTNLTIVGASSITPPTIVAQSSTTLCGTNTVQLCPSAYGWSNYQWYKNGVAVTNNGASACIVIDTSRLGSYTLAATTGVCWTSQSNAIAVTTSSAPATPSISASGSTSICNGSSVTLTSSSASGNQWKKDGIAISGVTAQTYSATISGVYTVTVSVCGSTTSAGTTVTVAAPITVAAISASSNPVCLGGVVTMTSPTTGGIWSSSNTVVATINATGIVTSIAAGTTTITYTKTVGGCSNSATYSLTVQGSSAVTTPTLDVRGSTAICGSGSLQICPLVWGYSNYKWYKDGVVYSTSSCITVNTAGSYTLTGTNGSGCWSAQSSAAVVTVNPLPTVLATSGPTSLCVASTIALTNATTTPAGGTSYWSSIAGLASVNSAGVVTGNSIGTAIIAYNVVTSFGCKASANYNVIVNAIPSTPGIGYAAPFSNPQQGAPNQGFCVGKVFGVAGSPLGGVWSASGCISITSAGIATINTTGSGSLTYTYTNANGCSNFRTMTGAGYVCAAKSISLNSEEVVVFNNFTVYPNPTTGRFTTTFVSTASESVTVNVTEVASGKTVYTKSIAATKGNNTLVIDLNKSTQNASGIYLVSIKSDTQSFKPAKLVVNKN